MPTAWKRWGTMRGAEEPFSGRRVKILAAGLVALGAAGEVLSGRPVSAALSLTGAGVVAIINFHWLEQLLGSVLQPGRPRVSGPVLVRIMLKALLLIGFFVVFLLVPQIDPVAVALGFTALVAALLAEGIRWGMKGGDEA